MSSRPRIIVASPHAAERTVLADWLSAENFDPVQVSGAADAAEEIRQRPCDLLVADAMLASGSGTQMIGSVRARNAKTPIVIVGDADRVREAEAGRRGMTYVSRPLDQTWFTCTISMALMETRPERRSLRKAVDRFDAVVDGVPSHIVDVSNEGLRLEIPRSRRAAPPPPFFNVSVPMLGLSLCVRRMWTCGAPQAEREASWYGAELARNQTKIEKAWIGFVAAVPSGRAPIQLA